MTSWLYTANTKFYDVLSALANDVVYWPASTSVAGGDTVYLYLAASHKQIGWVCSVEAAGLPEERAIEACRPFFLEAPKPSGKKKTFMQLQVVQPVALSADSTLAYRHLKEHGLKGMLMGPRKLDNAPELLAYIQQQCSGA